MARTDRELAPRFAAAGSEWSRLIRTCSAANTSPGVEAHQRPKHCSHQTLKPVDEPLPRRLTGTDWARIGAIAILTLFALLFWAGFEQAGSSLTLFADRATQLMVFGFEYPSSWFQSVEPLFVIVFSPVFAGIWLMLARRRREPSSPAKFTLGLFFSRSRSHSDSGGEGVEATGMRVSPWWLIGLYFLQMVGEFCLSPVGLSMVTKLAGATGRHDDGRVVLRDRDGQLRRGMGRRLPAGPHVFEVFQAAFLNLVIATVILAILIVPIKKLMRGVKT
jgi:POT family proton-dependent oligopeptide transporter